LDKAYYKPDVVEQFYGSLSSGLTKERLLMAYERSNTVFDESEDGFSIRPNADGLDVRR